MKHLGVFFVISLSSVASFAAVVDYQINIEYKSLNISGKETKVIALGKVGEKSGIPGPTLEFTEGDTARIILHNNLKEDASIHGKFQDSCRLTA